MNIFFNSHVGKKRRNNEDSVKSVQISDDMYLLLVADGVGGEKKGEVASERTVSHIEEFFLHHKEKLLGERKNTQKIQELICEAVLYANEVVFEMSHQDEFYMMASTVVLALIDSNTVYIANVGDSRCYLFRAEAEKMNLKQITKDHTFVQELVDKNIITAEEARTHREKNRITRAIGLDSEIPIDLYELTWGKDDLLLLCSDGLNSMLEDDQIQSIIEDEIHVKDIVEKLIQKALDNGGLDNVTVLCAKNCEVVR